VIVRPRYLHCSSMAKQQCDKICARTQGPGAIFLTHLAPHRRCFRFRIARRQQQLRLVRLERLR
jgi:hypothetical protein